MNDLQKNILNVFKEFKRVCDDYDLRYFAIGGTAIGAIRHKGFIPWDDDLDVAMPSEDYIKFINLCKKGVLNKRYILETPLTRKEMFYNFSKLEDSYTTFVETHKQLTHYKRVGGVFIDIMPIFGLPNDIKLRNSLIKKYSFYNKELYAFRYPISFEPGPKAVLYHLLCLPLKVLHNEDYGIERIWHLLERYNFMKSEKILFGWRNVPKHENDSGYKCIFDANDFRKSIEVPFEDVKIQIMNGYDNYLRSDFGDYMQLPPESKRVTQHDTEIIDLNTPFKEFLKHHQ